MGEVFSANLATVVIFMAVVLAVLLVLMLYLLVQYRRLRPSIENKDMDAAAVTLEESRTRAIMKEDPESDEEEIVAAIIAAICTYSGMSAEQFTIKSIKLVNSGNSNWRRESIIRE